LLNDLACAIIIALVMDAYPHLAQYPDTSYRPQGLIEIEENEDFFKNRQTV